MSHKLPQNDERPTVTTFIYDAHDRLTARFEAQDRARSGTDEEFDRMIPRCQGKIVDSVPGARGYCAAPRPSWTFGGLAADRASAYDLYIASFVELGGWDWQGDYCVSGGTLAPAADPSETWLGTGWHKLGSVTLPTGKSELTVRHHGSEGTAAAAVMLMQIS